MPTRRIRCTVAALVLTSAAGCASEAGDGAALRTTTTAPTTTTAEATTTTAESTTTAPPTTESPLAGLGSGTPQLVGTDVQPGVYMSPGGPFCYWERLSGLGGSLADVIINGVPEGPAIVEIAPGDAAFSSNECGDWAPLEPSGAPVTEFGPGDWAVNDQIEPGTYRAEGGLCMWELATGFQHGYDEVIDFDIPEGPVVVEIGAGAVRFTSTGCGTWTRA